VTGDPDPCYDVAVLLGSTRRHREGNDAAAEVVVSIPHALLHRLSSLDLMSLGVSHPALQPYRRQVEVLRVCWRCGGTHALRYELNDVMPSVPKDYDCPYCSARQEEQARFADGLDVRLAVFPRSRPTRG
jgi:hypothetical protein